MIRNRADHHWLSAHGRFCCQWLQCSVKNMLIVIFDSFPIGSLLDPLFCSARNLTTTIANELKAFTKYNHAGTMQCACVCSNISGFCSVKMWRAGCPKGCHIFLDRLISKVPKISLPLFPIPLLTA